MLQFLSEDALCQVCVLLRAEDLASLRAAGSQGQAMVQLFLEAEHGHRFRKYMAVSMFTRPPDCGHLMRFVAPSTNAAWCYRCGVCGRAISQIAECPCRYLNAIVISQRRRRISRRVTHCVVTASILYCSILLLSDILLVRLLGGFAWFLIVLTVSI